MISLLDDISNATLATPKVDPRSTLSVVFQVSLLGIINVVAIAGNMLILVAISRFTCLQTKTNVFVMNLALADLLLATFAMPFTLASSVTYEWVFGDVMCYIQGVFNSLFCEASILTLTFVSLERFVAILYPLRYQELMTANTVKAMIVYIWAQASICAMSTFLFSRFDFLRFESLCTVDWAYSTAYTLSFAFIFLFVPFCMVCVMYCLILKTALAQQKKISALKLGAIEDKGGPRKDAWNEKSSNDIRKNQGNLKQEHRATLMIFIVVGTFCVCWIPHAIGAFCLIDPNCHWADSFYIVTTWLAMLNSAMNSVIYGLMNKNFRRAFNNVVLCKRYVATDIEITTKQ